MAAHGDGAQLTRIAVRATLHCLTGCAIGEVLGMVIGTALGWGDLQTVALAVGLAFVFGYAMTVVTVPVNRWLIARGRGHAAAHNLHGSASPDVEHTSHH